MQEKAKGGVALVVEVVRTTKTEMLRNLFSTQSAKTRRETRNYHLEDPLSCLVVG
jgi:hypothetical protein